MIRTTFRSFTLRSALPVAVVAAVCATVLTSSATGAAKESYGAGAGLAASTSWTGAWATGQQELPGTTFNDQTLRLLVHPTIGGSPVRIRLANTFGAADITVDSVAVGIVKSASAADLVPGSSRKVTFYGDAAGTIAQGAKLVSDPVPLNVKFGQTLAVDIHLASSGTGAVTGHQSAGQGSFTATGNHVGEEAATAFTGQLSQWFLIDGVDVVPARGVSGTVVALGDSITDGAYSAWNGNKRWPDVLADRLQALPRSKQHGVLNQGIGGNRVIAFRGDCCPSSDSALARLDRDVLAQTDVRTLLIADGINDIGYNAPADQLIKGLRQLGLQAKAVGVRVIGATITPYGCEGGCLGAEQEASRQAVNTWIRTNKVFDGYVDFDKAVRDPAHVDRLQAIYDAGDHLHLNDAGYAALANSVDLNKL